MHRKVRAVGPTCPACPVSALEAESGCSWGQLATECHVLPGWEGEPGLLPDGWGQSGRGGLCLGTPGGGARPAPATSAQERVWPYGSPECSQSCVGTPARFIAYYRAP